MNPASRTYRFIALSMAFLMFSTSANFAVDMHFCQGKLKSTSFFGKAKNCHEMAAAVKGCPHHQKMMEQSESCSEDDKDCCENKILQFQSDQDQQIQTSNFTISQPLQQFVAAYVYVFFKNTFSADNDAASFAYYRPPLISRDIPVLFETFLI